MILYPKPTLRRRGALGNTLVKANDNWSLAPEWRTIRSSFGLSQSHAEKSPRMHLQQTKSQSRRSGGPQYYFHSLDGHVKEFLRKRGACDVVLQTPYGITASSFIAVDRDHKIVGGNIVPGSVGHDRIQQGTADHSIGEEIRHWYGLKSGDFETIEIEVEIHKDGHFIVVPTAVSMRGRARWQTLEKIPSPLSIHRDYQSKFWRVEIERRRNKYRNQVTWAASQIRRIVQEHLEEDASHIPESDLLRTAGALSHLGVELSAHTGKGYDCPKSQFRFDTLPTYPCPIELKKRSRGFRYQFSKYTELPRVVVLCIKHDYVNIPNHIDVIELPALADYLDN
jgi:hypothetical protein